MKGTLKMNKSKTKLYGFSGKRLQVQGQVTVYCEYKDRGQLLDFHIVDTPASPVLGLEACPSLHLIKLVLSLSDNQKVSGETSPDAFKKEYADVFQGLGCFPGEHKFKLDKNISPVVHPPCRVPHALKGRLKQELDRMYKCGSHCAYPGANRLGQFHGHCRKTQK